jgi:hypothetical protein
MNQDIEVYKELVNFCNANKSLIETKFERDLVFNDFNEKCFQEMYVNIKDEENPIAPKILKDRVPGLAECYRFVIPKFLNKRNEFVKGLDIQLGQWYEKAFQLFLSNIGIPVHKKGFPFPDFLVGNEEKPIAYYELKYIAAPFISAHTSVKNTYPYSSTRFDYECSLTLDTGRKMEEQRIKIERDILSKDIPVYYVWWFDAPHLKGIFYMSAKEVFNYYDNVGTIHERESRSGDETTKQVKGKIYPPLLKMKSLKSLINDFSI